jgi:N-methylhydantoinase A/oxoprolinase/acetone carboxylase beta subunit
MPGSGNILTLDVGGTSTDVALIENLEPRRQRTTEVGHLSVPRFGARRGRRSARVAVQSPMCRN